MKSVNSLERFLKLGTTMKLEWLQRAMIICFFGRRKG
jgi:hypothetical protein